MESRQTITKREFIKLGMAGCAACLIGGNLSAKMLAVDEEYDIENWKWKKEAIYYIATPKGLKCKVCPQNCTIEEGKLGTCRTRIAKGDKLFTVAYGNPCAIHIDPIEKKPLYHFVPASLAYSLATAGCNLACLNCQNWTISQKSPFETRNYDLMPGRVVEEAIKYNTSSIAFTYSEPIVYYEYVYDTAKIARLSGLKTVLVSAGYINEQPLRELNKYIDAANIDLKSMDDQIYEMLNAGTLKPVLETLKIMKAEGVWLEITNLVVPTWTDDLDMIKRMCNWLAENGFTDTPLHFSRFHPDYKLTNLPPTPVETLVKAREIAFESGLRYVYIGNVPGSEGQNTYCPSCKKLVVRRKGFDILENKINKGSCSFCGTAIAGIWN